MLTQISAVEEQSQLQVLKRLESCPNPAGSNANIRYELNADCPVTLTVSDVAGRTVARLVDGRHGPGEYVSAWNCTEVPAGIYYCTLVTGSTVSTHQLVVNH